MANIAQMYYLDASSLGGASSIYTDSNMTQIASDGFYSDGVSTREMYNSVLLPLQPCPYCGSICSPYAISYSGNSGVYILNVELNISPLNTGAIVIKFNPLSSPEGIIASFNGVNYNALSSQTEGLLKSNIVDTPTYIGLNTEACGILSGGSNNYDEYLYDGSAFNPTGNTNLVTVDTSQVKLTDNYPSNCFMVIPKPSHTPSTISIMIYGVCDSTSFDITVNCPESLPVKNRSEHFDEYTPEFCSAPINLEFYTVPVNGTSTTLGLYDWCFVDNYGGTILPDGLYKGASSIMPSGYDSFQVKDGVITKFLSYCV